MDTLSPAMNTVVLINIDTNSAIVRFLIGLIVGFRLGYFNVLTH